MRNIRSTKYSVGKPAALVTLSFAELRRTLGGSGRQRCCCAAASSYDCRRSRTQNPGKQDCGDSPRQQPMGRVAKEHFIRVNSSPSRSQAASEISAQSGRKPLNDNQPDCRRYGKGRWADPTVRPWRNHCESQAGAHQQQDQRQRHRNDRASNDRAPGDGRSRCFVANAGFVSSEAGYFQNRHGQSPYRYRRAMRMITGIGTPRSQSRMPRPIAIFLAGLHTTMKA